MGLEVSDLVAQKDENDESDCDMDPNDGGGENKAYLTISCGCTYYYNEVSVTVVILTR